MGRKIHGHDVKIWGFSGAMAMAPFLIKKALKWDLSKFCIVYVELSTNDLWGWHSAEALVQGRGQNAARKIRITLSLILILTLTPQNSSTVYPLQHLHNCNLHFTIDCRPGSVTPSSSPGPYKTQRHNGADVNRSMPKTTENLVIITVGLGLG